MMLTRYMKFYPMGLKLNNNKMNKQQKKINFEFTRHIKSSSIRIECVWTFGQTAFIVFLFDSINVEKQCDNNTLFNNNDGIRLSQFWIINKREEA